MDRTEDKRLLTYSGLITQGDLYWIGPDETRGSIPSHPHPHVVVQEDIFNHSRISTVIVCALSSNLNCASEPGNVLLEPNEGNLDKQSVIVVSQVSSLYKARLGKRIGTLSRKRIEEVLAGMRFLQTLFFAR